MLIIAIAFALFIPLNIAKFVTMPMVEVAMAQRELEREQLITKRIR